MCGISGIISRRNLTRESKAAVTRMSLAQAHRGPDGAGDFTDEKIALSSRRLSIIDRDGGWQPLYNEDKSLVLVINGEIYNYVELHDRLRKSGHEFRSATDGEVILHLYEEDPVEFISHLRGMFAFALWDKNRRRLILARDRMGEKPLYLFERDGELLFASELKGLLHSGLVPFKLDPTAVNLYFHFQYVPEPLTALKNVRKLDAGKTLTIDLDSWEFHEKTYWCMEDAPPIDGDPVEIIRQRLEEVSILTVRADTPVGVALSGGLDSSVVAAFAVRQQRDLQAFSVGYAGRPDSDERAEAEKLARHLEIPFFEVELATREIVDFFPELNYWRDDPIADIAGAGYYAVMKLARDRGVSVLLQGQGGDELFWGYPQLREAFDLSEKKGRLLDHRFSQTILQSLTLARPQNRSVKEILAWTRDFGGIRSGWRNVRERLQNPERFGFYEASTDYMTAQVEMNAFYHPLFKQEIGCEAASSFFDTSFGQDKPEIKLTALICSSYLRENGIAQGDRLGMASSVEMRLPLIDYKLVETIIGLRKKRSDAKLPPKSLLKEAVKDVLPEWILSRPKRGFAPPVREWHDALFTAYGDTLREGFLVQSNILSSDGASELAKGKFPGGNVCPLSFKALVLEQWARQMVTIGAVNV